MVELVNMVNSLARIASENVSTIVEHVFAVTKAEKSLIVFDRQCELAKILAGAYQTALPGATVVEFAEDKAPEILAIIESLKAGDFVALIQSSSFRLNEFRLRVELFKKGLKVVEHPHLDRMKSEADIATYIDSLAYDSAYYRTVGRALKTAIDRAQKIVVESDGSVLEYLGPFEDAKLNIGDYTGMNNAGGQFPIGEVFTEPKDIANVNGTAKIFAFGDNQFRLNIPAEPIELFIIGGRIDHVENSTPEFDAVLEEIREGDEAVVRELGLGMNKAYTRARTVPDVGSYERMCGVHMSLGGKHAIYAKEGFSRKHSRFHVDVFVKVDRVLIDGKTIFENQQYVV